MCDNVAHRLDLAVVMPVYNEQDCISGVIRAWLDILTSLEIEFRMIVLNDGSRDATAERLRSFSDNSRVEIIDKPNSGHGPTILLGYRRAVPVSEWVFQCDSDNEMEARHFPSLWDVRADSDAVFGYRTGRTQHLSRKIVSTASRAVVRIFFRGGVVDVNTPFRLMRSDLLGPIVSAIPDDTFAPNVIVSGMMVMARARIRNVPVPHEGRKTGTVSIAKWKLSRAAVRSLVQTVQFRIAMAISRRRFHDRG